MLPELFHSREHEIAGQRSQPSGHDVTSIVEVTAARGESVLGFRQTRRLNGSQNGFGKRAVNKMHGTPLIVSDSGAMMLEPPRGMS